MNILLFLSPALTIELLYNHSWQTTSFSLVFFSGLILFHLFSGSIWQLAQPDQMGDVFGVKALFEVLDVQADGAGMQAKAGGDLFGGAALGEQAEHLALALGQAEQSGGQVGGGVRERGAFVHDLEGDGTAAVGAEEIEGWRHWGLRIDDF
jgi:hypothetical protein